MTVEHAPGHNGHKVDDERLSEHLYAGMPPPPAAASRAARARSRLIVPVLLALATLVALRALARARPAQ